MGGTDRRVYLGFAGCQPSQENRERLCLLRVKSDKAGHLMSSAVICTGAGTCHTHTQGTKIRKQSNKTKCKKNTSGNEKQRGDLANVWWEEEWKRQSRDPKSVFELLT